MPTRLDIPDSKTPERYIAEIPPDAASGDRSLQEPDADLGDRALLVPKRQKSVWSPKES